MRHKKLLDCVFMEKLKYISILFALFPFISSYAQIEYEYIPFPKNNAIWSEVYITPGSDLFPPVYSTYFYERFAISGEDTIINNVGYKKIYMFLDSVFNKNTASYIGALREDEQ